ncbi:MAG: (deoxy)nucleoside triphosphate pyrophosphohydrolase [Candidatus Tectomicrobia bacterium]|uniref:8-oxo-dGTP diphosphatase n=1 Tax=Tectimicrobiota bacterium TaxID=2528274 RepID=A0A937VZ86_UNCTE|nr:(deoxy)nucleoside triphosphate pyrophosphohydrolase [Candidatus Tectomicrobia bacterium]
MSQSTSPLLVVAGVIQQGGKLLVCQRRHDSAFALKWEFPGGKVEPGEQPAAGLRRELQEELGILADIGAEAYRTCHDYPGHYTVELIFYHVARFTGVLENRAFAQLYWAAMADLLHLDFLAGDAELIRQMHQGHILLPQSQA